MILRTGVDAIEIERVQAAIQRHGPRFLERVFTSRELELCRGRVESLAARFAAKEAVSKALGTGVWRAGVCWDDIEILREEESGAPLLYLHGAARERAHALGLETWSVSLSHTRTQALAFVVGLGGRTP
ncbi:MAG: holo-[acyl-carrier-protein] synthase [Caldilineae bacterium]|nr:MAG: holo-[acyl-carrier-protein] synthase [Caldilineae bacterium]